MENFDKYFTVEHKSEKGWQVIDYYEGLHEAVIAFRNYVLADGDLQEYRLTTPTRHTL